MRNILNTAIFEEDDCASNEDIEAFLAGKRVRKEVPPEPEPKRENLLALVKEIITKFC